MSEIIFGRNPVLEALRAGNAVEKILVDDHLSHPRLNEILKLAGARKTTIQKVPRQKLIALAGQARTQGVVAYVAPSAYATVADILQQARVRHEPPLLACLDGIEDPHNLGAILRSADGAGLHGVVLPKRRSAGMSGTVAKTSAGASAHVLMAQVSNLNYAIDSLKEQNIWCVGADQQGTQTYSEADLTCPLAVVVGAEGKGLHRLVREKCDFLVRIPLFGKLNSLNASVAAALLFFEARRQRCLAQDVR